MAVVPSLAHYVQRHAHQRPEEDALLSKRSGRFEALSWAEWWHRARLVAARLVTAGVAPGDNVAIASSSREEWVVAETAITVAGAVSVPIYPTVASEQAVFLLRDAGVRFLFAEDAAFVARLENEGGPDAAATLGALAGVVLFDGAAAAPAVAYADVVADGSTVPAQLDAELEARLAALTLSAPATVVYTSGTSGEPKGVVLTHDSLLFETEALERAVGLSQSDLHLLLLPLAHVFARIMVATQIRVGCVTAFSREPMAALDDAVELAPTVIGCVPRLFEKVFELVHAKVADEGAIKQSVFDWAVTVGRRVARHRELGLPIDGSLWLQHRYADKLVLSKIRARFGKRLRLAVSGGAPLSVDLCEWFHGAGVTLLEGYGLTESGGATHVNRPGRYRFGSVGQPLDGIAVKIAPDGEVLVRGRNVMQGYLGRPSDTAEVIDAEGWLHTGDVGRVDDDGFLTITDRKKDILVTAGGKNVAPQVIEAALARSAWVSRAIVCGDRRPYLVALLVLDAAAALRFAQERKLSENFAVLAVHPELRSFVARDVDAANKKLAPFERVKTFAILPQELTVEMGELTASLKVRRKAVAARYKDVIDGLYVTASTPP